MTGHCVICSENLHFNRKSSAVKTTLVGAYAQCVLKHLHPEVHQCLVPHFERPESEVLCLNCKIDLKFLSDFEENVTALENSIKYLQEEVVYSLEVCCESGGLLSSTQSSRILKQQVQVMKNFGELHGFWRSFKRAVGRINLARGLGSLDVPVSNTVDRQEIGDLYMEKHNLNSILLPKTTSSIIETVNEEVDIDDFGVSVKEEPVSEVESESDGDSLSGLNGDVDSLNLHNIKDKEEDKAEAEDLEWDSDESFSPKPRKASSKRKSVTTKSKKVKYRGEPKRWKEHVKADQYIGLLETDASGSLSFRGIKVEVDEVKVEGQKGGKVTLGHRCSECGHFEKAHVIQGDEYPNERSIAFSSSRIRKHIIEHHTEGYNCPLCPRILPIKYQQLISHISKHKTKTCEICGKIFRSNKGPAEVGVQRCLWSHKNEEEKQAAIEAGEEPPPPEKQYRPQPRQCERCGKTITRGIIGMEQHMKKYHDECPQEKSPCPQCGKLLHDFETKIHQRSVHDKAYTKRYPCGQCEKIFTTLANLQNHTAKIHEGKPSGRHECKDCGRQFFKQGSLREHLMKVHGEGKKPHSCSECGKEFWRKEELREHVGSLHQANPDHSCGVCGKVISRLRDMKRHMERHKPKDNRDPKLVRDNKKRNPAMCDLCGKVFSRNRTMEMHKKKVHC